MLLVEWGRYRALLLAEQGYRLANPEEWIENLQPQLVVLSVAADDAKGMPSVETVKVPNPHHV